MSPDLLFLALALLSAPPPAAPAESHRACTLPVSASPARLEAREDRRVLLHASTPGEPRLEASVGRIEDLRRGAGGSWSATFVAPPVSIPQVAIVTVLDGDGCGFTAIPIHGAGDALVRTTPGAVVDVRIASRTFGPASAGPDGVALIPVEVPPGVYSVHHGRQEIPLGLPRIRHVAVHLGGNDAPADREVRVPVLVVAVEDDGAPRLSPRPRARVSEGSLSPLEAAGAGAYRAIWRLPAGRSGTATLQASLPGEEAATATLSRLPGSPTKLAVALDRDRAVAGDPEPVRLEVALADAAGNPSDGPVALEAEGLSVSAPSRTGVGAYRASIAVPRRLPGKRVEIVARSGSISSPVELALEPGPPARVEVVPDEEVVTADGRGTTVRIRVADAHGNPVDVPPDRIRVSKGEASPAVPDGEGAYSFRYVPPRSRSLGEEAIEVAVGEETARTVVRLRPRLSPLALLATAGVALRPRGGGAGFRAGAGATHWRWLGGHEAGLAFSLGWTSFRDETTESVGTGPAAFRGEVRELVLLLGPAWRSRIGRALSLELSLGAGAARVTSLVSLGGSESIPEAGWAPAAGVAASLARRAGPGLVLAELRAAWVRNPGLESLDRPASPLSLSLGYLFHAL